MTLRARFRSTIIKLEDLICSQGMKMQGLVMIIGVLSAANRDYRSNESIFV